MTDEKKSYDEVYYTTEGRTIPIGEIIEYIYVNKGKVGKYEGKIFCPECKKAMLTFVHGNSKSRPYVRKIPSASHLDECYYKHEYASNTQSIEYFESLSGEALVDKLKSIMRMLNKMQDKTITSSMGGGSSVIDRNPFIINNRQRNIRVLPRKSLNSFFNEEDCGRVTAFYGKVQLEAKKQRGKYSLENGDSAYYFLDIFSVNRRGERKKRASIYLPELPCDINSDEFYNIVAIGVLNKNKNWYKIELIRKAICIEKV